jgi:cbb3-type cytochrome oxidase maturation protein
MNISYLLVVLGLAAFFGAVWALFWAVDSGQFDDLEAQGSAILEDSSAPGPAPAGASPPPPAPSSVQPAARTEPKLAAPRG